MTDKIREIIEEEIETRGLKGPRITPAMIDAAIVDEEYHLFPSSQLTICVLCLVNGFTVTGESACVSPENFDPILGKRIAKDNARSKIWVLEGYLLKQKLFENQKP